MKKLFVLLGVFCALCFVACSNFQLAGGDMGVVSLSIGDNLAREIRSAAASLRSATGGSYTLTASIRGEYSDSQTVTVADGNYSGVTFTFEDVPVGKRIILDLTAKADGNYIWYGNSGKHMVVSGINNLNVAVGRVSGVLMWNNSSVKIAPYGKYEAGSSLFNASPSSIAWCFDNAGNIYWYVGEENAAYRSDIQSSDSTYQQNSQYYYSPPFYAFTHDATTDILYGIGDGGSVKYWSGTESDSKEIMDSDGRSLSAGERSLRFAVHDNIAYIANYTEWQDKGEDAPILGVVQFSSYKLEDAPSGTKNAKLLLDNKTFTLPEIFGSNPPSSQMIYQEGALYLLLGSVSSSSNVDSADTKVYSCGALVKINPSTLTIDTSFGNNGYLGLVSTERQVPYTDSSGQKQSYSVYAASSPTEKVFSKPLGFVAIMPKKLVIADAGCIVSDETVDQGGVFKLKGKAVSRIVTVDLETQSLGFEDLNPNQYYWTDLLGSFVVTSSSYF